MFDSKGGSPDKQDEPRQNSKHISKVEYPVESILNSPDGQRAITAARSICAQEESRAKIIAQLNEEERFLSRFDIHKIGKTVPLVDYFRNAINVTVTLHQLAGEAIIAEDFERAKILAEQVLQHSPSDGLALLSKIYLELEDFPQLIQVLERLKAIDPGSPLNYSFAASAHFAMGNKEKALEEAKSYLSTNDEDILEYRVITGIFYNLGECELARQSAQKLLNLNPDDSSAIEIMFLTSYYDLKSEEEALFYAEKVWRNKPTDDAVIHGLVDAYRSYKTLEEAENVARYLVQTKPDSNHALGLLIEILLNQSKLDEADSLLDQLRQRDPEFKQIPSWTEFLEEKKRHPDATVEIPTSYQPTKTRRRVGEKKKSAPKPQEQETKEKTTLATLTHKATMDKFAALIVPHSEQRLRVGTVNGDKGFDFAAIRKGQVLLAEIKSINTSVENERNKIIEALGQLQLYYFAYIKNNPLCCDKKACRLIVLSQRPNYPHQQGTALYDAVAGAEQDGSCFVLWFEGDQICGSDLAMTAYEDYLTC